MKKLVLLIAFYVISSLSIAADNEYITFAKKSDMKVNPQTSLLLSYITPSDESNVNSSRTAIVRLTYTRDNQSDLSNKQWEYTISYTETTSKKTGTLTISKGVSFSDIYSVSDVIDLGTKPNAMIVINSITAQYKQGDNIISVSGNDVSSSIYIPNDIQLELILVNEKTIYLDISKAITLKIDENLTNNRLNVSWTGVEGAEEYDLEYSFIDATRDPSTSIETDPFKIKEPVRVRVKDTKYILSLAYPAGTLYFRVRAVGKFAGSNSIQLGNWFDLGTSVYEITQDFEKEKNWIYNISFAENGKSKQVLDYADGLLRKQQSLTQLSTNDVTVVQTDRYDFEGRPAITILPAPVDGNELTYRENLNTNLSGDLFGKNDFDKGISNPLGHYNGTGKYYSSQNGFNTSINNNFVPDAEGYAYTQTEYTRDNTGKPFRVSGLGKTHKLYDSNDALGSTHESKYYYVKPSEGKMRRLFGSNLGNISHYKKTIQKDANGQLTSTYIDQKNRTVATSLIENTSKNLINIDNAPAIGIDITEPLMRENKLIKNGVNVVSKSVEEIFNPFENGPDVNFTYKFSKGVISPGFVLETGFEDESENIFKVSAKPQVTDEDIKAQLLELLGATVYAQEIQDETTTVVPTASISNENVYEGSNSVKIDANTVSEAKFRMEVKENDIITASIMAFFEETGTAGSMKLRLEQTDGTILYETNVRPSTVNEWEELKINYTNTYTGVVFLVIELNVAGLIPANGTDPEIAAEKSTWFDNFKLTIKNDQICYSCKYKLDIKAYNPDGTVCNLTYGGASVPAISVNIENNNGNSEPYDAKINGVVGDLVLFSIPTPAQEGVYKIVKELSVQDFASDFNFEDIYPNMPGYKSLPDLIAEYELQIDPSSCDFTCEDHWASYVLEQQKTDPSYGTDDQKKTWMEENCEVNEDDLIEGCETLLDNIKAQVSPGGVFFDNLTSSFWSNLTVDLVLSNIVLTKDDGTPIPTFDLAYIQDPINWQNNWATQFAQYHPEFCQYEKCNTKRLFDLYRYKMAKVETWPAGTIDEGYIYPLQSFSSSKDFIYSLFEVQSNSDYDLFKDKINNNYATVDGTSYSLLQFTDPTNAIQAETHFYDNLTTADEIAEKRWRLFRGFYDGEREKFMDKYLTTAVVCPYSNEYPEYTLVKPPFGNPPVYNQNPAPDFSQFTDDATEFCEEKVNDWLIKIKTYVPLTDVQETYARTQLSAYCTASYGLENPYGIITPEEIINATNTTDPMYILADYFTSQALLSTSDLVMLKEAKLSSWLALAKNNCPSATINIDDVATEFTTYIDTKIDSKYLLAFILCDGILTADYNSTSPDYFPIFKSLTASCPEVLKYEYTNSATGGCSGEGNVVPEFVCENSAALWNQQLANYVTLIGDYTYVKFLEYCINKDNPSNLTPEQIINATSTINPELYLIANYFETENLLSQIDLVSLKQTVITKWTELVYKNCPNAINVESISTDFENYFDAKYSNSKYLLSFLLCESVLQSDYNLPAYFPNLKAIVPDCPNVLTDQNQRSSNLEIEQECILPNDMEEYQAASNLLRCVNFFLNDPYGHGPGYSSEFIEYTGNDPYNTDLIRPGVLTPDEYSELNRIINKNCMFDGQVHLAYINYGGNWWSENPYSDITITLVRDDNPEIFYNWTYLYIAGDQKPDLLSLVWKYYPENTFYLSPQWNGYYVEGQHVGSLCSPVFGVEIPSNIASGITNNYDFEVTLNPKADCIAELTAEADDLALQEYTTSLEAAKEAYIFSTQSECMKGVGEDFYYTVKDKEYYYTLYYYDQSDNLVQTVSPEDVRLGMLTSADFASNGEWNKTSEPNYLMPTQYKYNSLNQIVQQSSKDGGVTNFYYNDIKQLRFSQNSKQQDYDRYSYTKFDNLGRLIETGEFFYEEPLSTTEINNPSFPTENCMFVTKTTYNEIGISADILDQKNLLGRVSAVEYFENPTKLSAASYYSYDVHGNVEKLVQYQEGLGYKTLRYEYDLISGNVNKVFYQEGKADQFAHKYEYDADNRLTDVYTSSLQLPEKYLKSNSMWEHDAKYFYYLHGPLARVEIGEDKVQGLDYAYTLQGWLKGVNSNTLVASRDIGLDASVSDDNLNRFIAQDAYGYSLGYFDGDYNAIHKPSQYFLAANAASAGVTQNQLFNGNIGQMTTSIYDRDGIALPQLTQYKYDQLNRIKEMNVYKNSTVVESNNWTQNAEGLSEKYKSEYTYDYNGNITNLKRKNNFGSAMDDLEYKYNTVGTAPEDTRLLNNKLNFVNEQINNGVDGDDLKPGQLSQNYKYDAIGNLISDASEEIANIEWTPSGKIKKITRFGGSEKYDLEFCYDAMGNRAVKIVKPKDNEQNLQDQSFWEYTYYVHDASGQLMAVYDKKFKIIATSGDENQCESTLKPIEFPIYGSSRIGTKIEDRENKEFSYFLATINNDLKLEITQDNGTTFAKVSNTITRKLGNKTYELTNHLGNVLTTISDKKYLNEILPSINIMSSFEGGDENLFRSDYTGLITTEQHRTDLNSIKLINRDGSNPDDQYGASVWIKVHSGDVIDASLFGKKLLETDNGKLVVNLQNSNRQHIYGTDGLAEWFADNIDHTDANDNVEGNDGWEDLGITYKVPVLSELRTTSDVLNTTTPNPDDLYIVVHAWVPLNGNEAYFDDMHVTVTRAETELAYHTDIKSSTDYYPGGSIMPGRSFSSNLYRYSYQGSEKDDEITGVTGAHITTFFRENDTRILRWWAVDPETALTPWESPYMSMGGNPILNNDPLGDKWYDKETRQQARQYRRDTKQMLKSGVQSSTGDQLTMEDRNQLKASLSELKTLRKSDQLYKITQSSTPLSSGANGFAAMRNIGGENVLDIVLNNTAGNSTLSHELKHAYQFEIGQISYVPGSFWSDNPNGIATNYMGAGILYDREDEVAAFKRSFAWDHTKFTSQGLPMTRYSHISDKTITWASYGRLPLIQLSSSSRIYQINYRRMQQGRPDLLRGYSTAGSRGTYQNFIGNTELYRMRK